MRKNGPGLALSIKASKTVHVLILHMLSFFYYDSFYNKKVKNKLLPYRLVDSNNMVEIKQPTPCESKIKRPILKVLFVIYNFRIRNCYQPLTRNQIIHSFNMKVLLDLPGSIILVYHFSRTFI